MIDNNELLVWMYNLEFFILPFEYNVYQEGSKGKILQQNLSLSNHCHSWIIC